MISFSKEEYKFPSVPVSRDSNYDELKALIVISRDIRVFCVDCSWVSISRLSRKGIPTQMAAKLYQIPY